MGYPIEELRRVLIEEGSKKGIEEIRTELLLKDDEYLCKSFCSLLENDIKTIDYDGQISKYGYIITLIKYINMLLYEKRKIDYDATYSKLDSIVKLLEEEKNKLDQNEYKVWINFLNALIRDVTSQRNSVRVCQSNINDDKGYAFLQSLINTRDAQLIESTLKYLPNIVNSRNEKGELFFEKYLIMYLKNLSIHLKGEAPSDSFNKQDVLYSDYIINALLSIENSDIWSSRKDFAGRIGNLIKCIDDCKCPKSEKNEIRFLLETLRSRLKSNNTANLYDKDNLNKKYGKSNEFPEQVMKEVTSFKPKHKDFAVKDLTHLYTITIDNHFTLVIDDAISYELLPNGNHCVYIHTVDVGKHVEIGSQMELEAYKRCESIYLNGSQIPMFPEKFTSDYCSLFHDRKKSAITCAIEIDKYGEVIGHEVYKSIINVNNNLSYEKADTILLNGDKESKLSSILKSLYEVSCLIGDRSISNPMHVDLKSVCKITGLRINRYYKENNISEKIIKNLLVIANCLVTQDLLIGGHSCIGKIYKTTDTRMIMTLITEIERAFKDHGEGYYKAVRDIVDSSYNRTIYANLADGSNYIESSGHYTSAIRKYSDYLTQKMISDLMLTDRRDDKLAYFYEEHVKKAIQDLNITQAQNIQYSSSYNILVKK